jgi:hypothetical protein
VGKNGWLLICSENLSPVVLPFWTPVTLTLSGVMLSKLPITEKIAGLDAVAEMSVTLELGVLAEGGE